MKIEELMENIKKSITDISNRTEEEQKEDLVKHIKEYVEKYMFPNTEVKVFIDDENQIVIRPCIIDAKESIIFEIKEEG